MKRLLLVLAACSQPSSARPAAPAPAAACSATEHRQLDFWVGDWDVKIHARNAPDQDAWADSSGTQHVEAILGGCAISESFAAGGPQPWAGKSYSVWVPKLAKWRQTWVDDSGNYLAFTGGVEAGAMTLYGEPREADGKTIHMRMVFQDVTPRSLHWEWQRTEDRWATHQLMMAIDYVRR